MEWNLAKKYIIKSLVIISVLSAVVVPVVGGFALVDVGGMISYYCTLGNPFFGFHWQAYAACPIYVTLGSIFSIVLCLFLAGLTVAVFIDIIKWIPGWILKPSPNNLRVYPGSLHGNIYTLKFRSTEWRYPFTARIAQAAYIPTVEGKELGMFEWRGFEKLVYAPIKRFRFHEINFIEVDEKDHSFWIKKTGQHTALGQGSYAFIVRVINHMGKTLPPTKRDIYLIVDYKGGSKISVKIEKERDVKKRINQKTENNQKNNP